LKCGNSKDAEKLLKILFHEKESNAAAYYLLNMYMTRNRRREASGLNLPYLSHSEQFEKYGVVAGLPAKFKHIKFSSDSPRWEQVQKNVHWEKTRKRLIRISTFDEKDQEKLIAAVTEEDLGEDVYLAAFRIRMECNHDRQDVEVVEYQPGYRYQAIYRHQGQRMDALRRRQIQIRDWLIYGCSCTPRNGSFKSRDPLPVDSKAMDWPLRQLILHRAYQMQALELICSDGVVKKVEQGIISPFDSSALQERDPYDEEWKTEVAGEDADREDAPAPRSGGGSSNYYYSKNYNSNHHSDDKPKRQHHTGNKKGGKNYKPKGQYNSNNNNNNNNSGNNQGGYRSSRQRE
jgi:hypothetical protein